MASKEIRKKVLVPEAPIPQKIGKKAIGPQSKIIECIVTITTGSVKKAGTDADVYFEIAGHRTLLDKPGYNDFEKGDTDTYHLGVPAMTLKELRESVILLYHDNTGKYPGWYVDKVDMKVRFENTYIFKLYKRWWYSIGWLAKDEGPYYTTQATLQDGTEMQ
ncbi:PLAT/LH2 domain-containing protein [Anaerobaca lacustris]|uniref:PLAT/LH2 domain-containing protein n=1 Tax=Anaerobaca lacustris TaxID=3044600 RepID=A0AAW6TXM3_9BACT|nr:PLAT/LH2 domain-containing protein [Sedimentisphaerales bacterium M17dextr]